MDLANRDQPSFVSGLDPHDQMRARLDSAVERGGFLALTLRGRHLLGAATAIAAAYPVRAVDLGEVFVEEFRALVAERGQYWGKVLTIDARFTESGRMSPGLTSYLRTSWERVRERLEHLVDPTEVLFLHGAGLRGRYAFGLTVSMMVRKLCIRLSCLLSSWRLCARRGADGDHREPSAAGHRRC